MVTTCSSMPPKLGIAIGSIISAPRPVAVSTGSRARMVVAVVIIAGLTRRRPPSTTAALTSATVVGSFFSKLSRRKVATSTPSSVAIPNRARKPTQTATLRLMVRI